MQRKQRKLTVSQLNAYISGVFEDEFVLHDVIVRGEIFELKVMGARTFFTLREGDCTLNCVTFSAVNVDIGAEVDVTGTVTFYAKSGRVSFVAEYLTVTGEGVLLAELKKLKEALGKEGLFANRPPLPQFIRKAVVITSEHGAVLHDILSVCNKEYPAIDICLCDVRVQGSDSADTIAEAIRDVNEHCKDADVIIIARGGGSASDLQSYNTETVARAVAGSKLPVISAVGHETDYTLCDLCATARAGTPSIAASMICAPAAMMTTRLFTAAHSLEADILRLYDVKRQQVIYNAMRVISLCERLSERRAAYVHKLISGVAARTDSLLSFASERFAAACAALEKLNPLKVLSQGYAKVSCKGGELTGMSALKAGDIVTVTMHDGKFNAEVMNCEVMTHAERKER